jgi:hypothetical protein
MSLNPFKWIRRIILAVVLLVILAGVIIYLNLDRVIRNTVQSQATSSTNLQTTLNSASLSLFGGKLNLSGLQIASPPGFQAPQMLDIGSTNLAVSYGQLRNDPVHVAAITIDKPKLVIEQKNGELNFKKAMDDMPKSPDTAPANSKPLKVIIDDLKLDNPQVVVKGFGATDIPLSLPSIELKNIGTGNGSQNGAAMKDVLGQVMTAIAAAASDSSALSAEFKQVLNANVGAALTNLGAEAQKRVAAAIPGQLGQSLSKLVSDPQALAKDPNKAIQSLLGGNKAGATTQPSNLQNDVKKQATDALQGLLGGKKK